MKKATSKTTRAAKSTADDVDAYLAKVPEPARTTLGKLRATIRAVVPSEATEGLSYGIPAFHFNGAFDRGRTHIWIHHEINFVRKSHCPQNTHGILLKAHHRNADGVHGPALYVCHTADPVEHQIVL